MTQISSPTVSLETGKTGKARKKHFFSFFPHLESAPITDHYPTQHPMKRTHNSSITNAALRRVSPNIPTTSKKRKLETRTRSSVQIKLRMPSTTATATATTTAIGISTETAAATATTTATAISSETAAAAESIRAALLSTMSAEKELDQSLLVEVAMTKRHMEMTLIDCMEISAETTALTVNRDLDPGSPPPSYYIEEISKFTFKHLQLNAHVYFSAVNYFWRYWQISERNANARMNDSKKMMNILTACVWLASKMVGTMGTIATVAFDSEHYLEGGYYNNNNTSTNEPELEEIVTYMTSGRTRKINRRHLLQAERELCQMLEFKFYVVTPRYFLEQYFQVQKRQLDVNMATSTGTRQEKKCTLALAEYLCELSLLERTMHQFKPSMIAASCICHARRTYLVSVWPKILSKHTGYSQQELAPCELALLRLSSEAYLRKSGFTYHKYKSSCYSKVSVLKPYDNEEAKRGKIILSSISLQDLQDLQDSSTCSSEARTVLE